LLNDLEEKTRVRGIRLQITIPPRLYDETTKNQRELGKWIPKFGGDGNVFILPPALSFSPTVCHFLLLYSMSRCSDVSDAPTRLELPNDPHSPLFACKFVSIQSLGIGIRKRTYSTTPPLERGELSYAWVCSRLEIVFWFRISI